ncbi:hypothetical protein AB2B38_011375 [Balneola sp. MJW-20]|uniref:hypothetical protein n=1 Tax=Gracilimonas aurantiaca TaxID=3234185 RepID=UPI00346689CB
MSEFSKENFLRINLINWALTVPMIVLFSWPYYYAAGMLGMQESLRFVGSFIFAIPFMITILHGHVTMALGLAHRDHYYQWLVDHPYSYGLFFSRLEISTRFRLILLITSLLLLPFDYIINL